MKIVLSPPWYIVMCDRAVFSLYITTVSFYFLHHNSIISFTTMAAIHFLILFALSICHCLVAHPTFYPHVAMKRGNSYRERAVPYPPPGIISYHIHITYTLFNPPVCMLYL